MKCFLYSFLLLSLSWIHISVFCQNHYPTENETHIFWQADRVLKIEDYQGTEPNDGRFDRNRELGNPVVPCLGIFMEVDIPKRYRKNKLEKVYFAPAFQKTCSFLIENDTTNFRDGQIQFDIYEIATRIARKFIWDMHAYMAIESDSTLIDVLKDNPDTVLITGVGNIFAARARDSAMIFAREMTAAYYSDLYLNVDSTSATYKDWRSLVDRWLQNHERFATKPEECYRMVSKKPILKNYIQAKVYNVF